MILPYGIGLLLVITGIFCYLEDRLTPGLRRAIYYGVGVMLILLAGLREIGIDPDSDGYESYYYAPTSTLLVAVEVSFILIRNICFALSEDVHLLFLLYALLGVGLKLWAIPKYCKNDMWLLMLFVYGCYYYELHETTQIRTGVLSGLMLLAIPYIAEKRRIAALLLILLGIFFHTSGLVLLPCLFLNNNPFTRKSALLWIMLIPASLVAARVFDSELSILQNIPYIGEKLANYQAATELGKRTTGHVSLLSPLHLLTMLITIYLMWFHDTLEQETPYFPLLMKIMLIGIFSYGALSFLPVMGERVSYLFRTVSIMLIPYIAYTIRPRWCGITVVLLIGFIYLNYIFRGMYDVLLLLGPTQ